MGDISSGRSSPARAVLPNGQPKSEVRILMLHGKKLAEQELSSLNRLPAANFALKATHNLGLSSGPRLVRLRSFS